MIEDHTRCFRVSDTGICSHCYSGNIIKNGTTKTKKQQYFCKNCKKRFLDYYTYHAYQKNINSQIVSLTKEGLGIKSTSRILKISPTTLLKRIIEIANTIINFNFENIFLDKILIKFIKNTFYKDKKRLFMRL
ncbi:IS1 family transposase [Chryseobacterium sp. G0201]|nr:IS1 family transposase [Chryseobacterium sp. G0201]